MVGGQSGVIAHMDEQTPIDGPEAIFRDPFIENLVGNWTITRRFGSREAINLASAHWVLNHQFLQIHMKDASDPPDYEAIVMIGYIHEELKYVAHWMDVFGGKFSSVGKGYLNGNSIEFTFQYDDGPFYNTFSWNESAGTWRCLLESVAGDGTRSFFCEDTLVRT